MKENFYNQEQIDAYLTGKLSGTEKTLFEEGISKDPLIKNEVLLQKEIIDSLKQFRKAELKQRLNNIDVSAGSSYTGMKIAASVLLLCMLTAGTVLYFNKTDQNSIAQPNSAMTETNAPVNEHIASSPDHEPNIITEQNHSAAQEITSSESSQNAKSELIQPQVNKQNNNRIEQNNSQTSSPAANLEEESKTAVPQHNEPTLADNDDLVLDSKSKLPKGDITHRDENKIDKLDVKVINKKKSFHYTHFNSKLSLYGDFNSKPYEIIELNSIYGKDIYLYFDNAFYEIKPNQKEITPLKEILDKDIIKELERLKK